MADGDVKERQPVTPKLPPPPAAREPVTPRAPVPLATLMSDGSIQVEAENLPLLELQRILLGAAGQVTARVVQRGAGLERVLTIMHARFDGWDADMERAITEALQQPR